MCLGWNEKNVRWNLKSLYFPGTHLFWLLISSHQSISKSALEEEEQEEEKPIWEPEMELQVLNFKIYIYIYIYGKVLAMTNQRVPRSAKKDASSHAASVCITQEY